MPENAAALVHNPPKASVCVPHCATNGLSTSEIALSSQFTSRHHCVVCVFLLLYNALDQTTVTNFGSDLIWPHTHTRPSNFATHFDNI